MRLQVVMFERENSLFSWIISLVTGSRYTHAGILIREDVYDADETRGTVRFAGKLRNWKDRRVKILSCRDPLGLGRQYAHSQEGRKYDYKGVFGWLFNRQSRRKLYCFEYVYYCLVAADSAQMIDDHNINQKDIINLGLNLDYEGKAKHYKRK